MSMSSFKNTAPSIGGYFELELPAPKPFLHPQALRFQSARAAFLALLRTGKPKRVWMPSYICDAMHAPVRKAGIECVCYSINQQLDIVDNLDLYAEDWLLYVNYFGVCTGNVDRVLARFNPNQVVIDNSQAFFAPPSECLATIYSPRKFFGVPDGGLLVTNLAVATPIEVDDASIGRTGHLLKRLAFSAESGYADYQLAEQLLCEFEPRQMSHLTSRVLESVDFEAVRKKRNSNFHFLHARLGNLNQLPIDLSCVDGPLCYPCVVDQSSVRERLIAERVFVATYWPDVQTIASDSSCEAWLVRHVLPLPCDQRYGTEEMNKIEELIVTNGKRR